VKLAVSFCRRSEPGALVAIVDEDGTIRAAAPPPGAPASACGLLPDGAQVLCAYTQSETSYLARYDTSSLSVVESRQLRAVRDVHSIVAFNGAIVAASTGSDEIVRLRENGDAEVLWRASAGERDDHHVNALCVFEGRLLCSAFGKRLGPAWADAVDGYVYDVSRGEYVVRGIYQPHSLQVFDGALYWCESARGAVRTRERDIFYVPGYARGLAIATDGSLAMGSSIGRRVPAWPGYLNADDRGDFAGACGVYTGSLHDGALSRIDLQRFGHDVYDIVMLA
jgi:hypothetical protein